jgi:LuxR family maltose regulon positive regulatory protein
VLSDSGRVAALADEIEGELAEAKTRAGSGELLDPPSAAELSVLQLMATDLSMREIGEQLYLSLNTIRSHIRAIYRKLGVHSREDAIARATALGLLDQTESPG